MEKYLPNDDSLYNYGKSAQPLHLGGPLWYSVWAHCFNFCVWYIIVNTGSFEKAGYD